MRSAASADANTNANIKFQRIIRECGYGCEYSLHLHCDVLLCVSLTLQSALESGQEARIVQIDFSAAFDRVNHLGILYKLSSVGIGGSVLSILTQFLSNRSQLVVVDGCRSKLVNVVSGVFWTPIIVPPVHFGSFFHFGK